MFDSIYLSWVGRVSVQWVWTYLFVTYLFGYIQMKKTKTSQHLLLPLNSVDDNSSDSNCSPFVTDDILDFFFFFLKPKWQIFLWLWRHHNHGLFSAQQTFDQLVFPFLFYSHKVSPWCKGPCGLWPFNIQPSKEGHQGQINETSANVTCHFGAKSHSWKKKNVSLHLLSLKLSNINNS